MSNENLNLAEILKDCKKGTKLYSPLFGEVEFNCIHESFSGGCVIECETECGVWFFNQDGSRNLQAISENNATEILFKELREGYFNNILEREALASGNGLRDKFKRFLEALSS